MATGRPKLRVVPQNPPTLEFELEQAGADVVRVVVILPNGKRENVVDIQSRHGDNGKLSLSRWGTTIPVREFFSTDDESRVRDFYAS